MSAGTASGTGELARIRGAAVLDALDARAGGRGRAEDVLVDNRLVSDRELACRLAERSGRPLVGLRDTRPDPQLFLYVSPDLALAQRVCPLELDGDVLRLASAYLDPDLRAVATRFPNLRLELVLAARDEILAAVRKAAGPR